MSIERLVQEAITNQKAPGASGTVVAASTGHLLTINIQTVQFIETAYRRMNFPSQVIPKQKQLSFWTNTKWLGTKSIFGNNARTIMKEYSRSPEAAPNAVGISPVKALFSKYANSVYQ